MATTTESSRRTSDSIHPDKSEEIEKDIQTPITSSGETPAVDVEKAPSSNLPPADDYDGPDDALNPMNWPNVKRNFHVFPPAFISLVATLGSAIYTPSYPELMKIYGISSTVALQIGRAHV